MECKQMYTSGIRVYLLDNYNWTDYTVLSLYLSSYVLRFLVDHWVRTADTHYNGTARAWASLQEGNWTKYDTIKEEIFSDEEEKIKAYFMKACK